MERNDSFLCFCLFQRPRSSDIFGRAFFSSVRYFRLGGVYSGCVALPSLLPRWESLLLGSEGALCTSAFTSRNLSGHYSGSLGQGRVSRVRPTFKSSARGPKPLGALPRTARGDWRNGIAARGGWETHPLASCGLCSPLALHLLPLHSVAPSA